MEKNRHRSPAAIVAGCRKDITDSVNRALSVLPCWAVELILDNVRLQVAAAAKEEGVAERDKEEQSGDSKTGQN